MRLHELLPRLQHVRKSGQGHTALCPSHADRTKASLSITEREGRILLHCFVGCETAAVVAALNLTMSDLFTEERMPTSRHVIVKTYDYRDEGGALLYQVCRHEPKDFRPRRPNGAGWTWSLGDVRRVVYRLPDLAEQPVVFVVEGEKDVEALWAISVPATTTQGGSSAWKDDYADQLVALGAQDIVILPDHDEAGEKYAGAVSRACLARGCRVKIVRAAGSPRQGRRLRLARDGPHGGRAPRGRRGDGLAHGACRCPGRSAPCPWGRSSMNSWTPCVRACPSRASPRRSPRSTRSCRAASLRVSSCTSGARPGTGKTAFGLEVARKAAQSGGAVLVVSREMVNLALARRLVSQAVRVPAAALRSGALQ